MDEWLDGVMTAAALSVGPKPPVLLLHGEVHVGMDVVGGALWDPRGAEMDAIYDEVGR
jgi:hypothetical protein